MVKLIVVIVVAVVVGVLVGVVETKIARVMPAVTTLVLQETPVAVRTAITAITV